MTALEGYLPLEQAYEVAVTAMATIKAFPQAWDQDTWRCGTSMCLAGWLTTAYVNASESAEFAIEAPELLVPAIFAETGQVVQIPAPQVVEEAGETMLGRLREVVLNLMDEREHQEEASPTVIYIRDRDGDLVMHDLPKLATWILGFDPDHDDLMTGAIHTRAAMAEQFEETTGMALNPFAVGNTYGELVEMMAFIFDVLPEVMEKDIEGRVPEVRASAMRAGTEGVIPDVVSLP